MAIEDFESVTSYQHPVLTFTRPLERGVSSPLFRHRHKMNQRGATDFAPLSPLESRSYRRIG